MGISYHQPPTPIPPVHTNTRAPTSPSPLTPSTTSPTTSPPHTIWTVAALRPRTSLGRDNDSDGSPRQIGCGHTIAEEKDESRTGDGMIALTVFEDADIEEYQLCARFSLRIDAFFLGQDEDEEMNTVYCLEINEKLSLRIEFLTLSVLSFV